MKTIACLSRVLLLGALVVFSACQSNSGSKDCGSKSLDSFDAKVSYAFGQDMGAWLLKQPVEVDLHAFYQGVLDTVQSDGVSLMLPAEAKEVMNEFRNKAREKQQAEQKASGAKNRQAAEEFLQANGQKDGIHTTASGLQYEVTEMGKGRKPASTDQVKVHYRGTHLDGSEFDSSYKRGQPATFRLNGVIKGWTEGLQLMPEGSKFKFYIPGELAYGSNGSPSGGIGADELLVFEVELIEIVK